MEKKGYKQLVVGITGLSAGVNLQCYFFKRMPEQYRMKWLCDLDENKVKKAIEEYEGKGTNKFDDLINDSEVDLITIATPVISHFTLAKHAMDAGKNVLLEKPISVSVDEANELIACAKRNKVVLCIDHERRFYANQKAVESTVKSGQLGRILSVRLDLPISSVIGNELPVDKNTWLQRFVKTHAYDYLVHHVDQVCRLLGEKPIKIFSRWQTLSCKDLPCEWEILMIMQSEVLASVNLRYSYAPDLKWIINGEDGSLRMQFENDMGQCFVYRRLPDGSINTTELYPSCTTQEAFIEFYQRLYDAITQGTDVPVSAEDSRDVIKVLWLAVESARTDQIINWNLF